MCRHRCCRAVMQDAMRLESATHATPSRCSRRLAAVSAIVVCSALPSFISIVFELRHPGLGTCKVRQAVTHLIHFVSPHPPFCTSDTCWSGRSHARSSRGRMCDHTCRCEHKASTQRNVRHNRAVPAHKEASDTTEHRHHGVMRFAVRACVLRLELRLCAVTVCYAVACLL